MNNRIAIYGATGAVGSALLVHLLKGNLLRAGDEIIMVSRDTEASHARLMAMRTDLMDAFNDGTVSLTICDSLQDLEAGIFIMAAGATVSPQQLKRRDLAEANLPVFEHAARLIAPRNPDAFILIVSNPIELAVEIFARHFDRSRVVGIGAQQDSLRFARAIADRLGLHRSAVRASVLGEHGDWMIPLWSSVYLTNPTVAQVENLASLRARYRSVGICESMTTADHELSRLTKSASVAGAYQRVSLLAPDVRIRVEPFITQNELHSTPHATSNAIIDCLGALLKSDGRKVHGQVLLNGEFYDLHGVCGAPVCLQRQGWRLAGFDPLEDWEVQRLRRASREINEANARVQNKVASHLSLNNTSP